MSHMILSYPLEICQKGCCASSAPERARLGCPMSRHVLSAYSLVSSTVEIARGAKGLVRMSDNQTFLDPPDASDTGGARATEKKTHVFSFDKSYWSAGPRDEPGYCSQQTLYNDLGKELLEHGFVGFNACILTCSYSWDYLLTFS